MTTADQGAETPKEYWRRVVDKIYRDGGGDELDAQLDALKRDTKLLTHYCADFPTEDADAFELWFTLDA